MDGPKRQLTLGSLFDGSGGFPLGGILNGIRPVWASEIEPFAIRVTKTRLPEMKHLGSVTDINGAEIEPVDIITFGSPCQDLSVAGKQKGIHDGERSNLFFEAIRIIKEMRNATANQFPRWAVWENVPGAFSSNKGEDFRAVLQALSEAGGGTAAIPRPAGGKWLHAGTVVGDGYSIAWRVYDAQYWGVPQRRARIYLVADFGSGRAGEILFEREGLCGNPAESGEAREGTATDAEGSVGGSDRIKCLTPWDCESKRQYEVDGAYRTLDAGNVAGGQAHGVCYAIDHVVTTGGNCTAQGPCYYRQTCPTLKAAGSHGVCYALDDCSSNSMKSNNPNSGFHEETVAKTLQTNSDPTCNQGGNVIVQTVAIEGNGTLDSHMGNGYAETDTMYTLNSTEQHKVAYAIEGNVVDREAKQNGMGISEDTSPSLNTQDKHAVAYGIDQQGGKGNAGYAEGQVPALCSDSHGTPHAVCYAPNGNHCGAYTDSDISATLQTRYHYGGGGDAAMVVYPEQCRTLTQRYDSSPCVDRGQEVIVQMRTEGTNE